MNVGFLIYKRPDLTARVFAEIARARPERLLVVADGPRNEAEREACRQARKVIEQVNWPCQVLTNYADANLGCRRRVAGGLDWVFTQVEEAIILEDDCLPHWTFFRYCAELLDRFRDDERVGHIGGSNFDGVARPAPYSYRFSRYVTIWGWATWRRAWRDYDADMKRWPELKAARWHYGVFPTRAEAEFFEANWDDIHAGRIDTWDGQWLFARLFRGSLSVFPQVNLVSNLGFRADGSHAFDARCSYANVPVAPMNFPLAHPPDLVINRAAELRFAHTVFPLRRPLGQRIVWRMTNRHWYGSLIRRLPVVGRLWRCWREGRS